VEFELTGRVVRLNEPLLWPADTVRVAGKVTGPTPDIGAATGTSTVVFNVKVAASGVPPRTVFDPKAKEVTVRGWAW
jgi:hypothetical protein